MNKKWKGRAALHNIKPYSPGKSIDEVKRELGLETVYKMASNENPLGPSPMAIEAMKGSLHGVHIYPDGSSLKLKEALAAKLGVESGQIIVGNGSDEIIKLLGVSFLSPEDTILMGHPSFSEYDFAGSVMGATVKKVDLTDQHFDLDRILEEMDSSVKIIALCNPNNPTGAVIGREELVRFMSKVPDHVIVVLDEAYKEYAGEDFYSGINFIKEGRENVVVLNTFSKIYGLAALRVGYGIAHEHLISWITRAKEPFNVNALAQIGAQAALADEDHVARSVALNEEGKQYLVEEFDKRGFISYPTGANFIWADIRLDSQEIFEGLLRKGVVIRPGSVFGAPSFIRVTIDKPEVNRYFIEMLDEVIKER